MFSFLFYVFLGASSTLYLINNILHNNVPDYFNINHKLNNYIKKNVDHLFEKHNSQLESNHKKTRDLIEDYMDDVYSSMESINLKLDKYNDTIDILNNNKTIWTESIDRASP